jgi:MFS family permease
VSQINNKKLGPIYLMPGVGRINALSFFPVALLNTSVFAFMNFMQPYVLEEHLGIARQIQGAVVGSVATMQELIILALTALMGAFADKVGRRPVFSIGLIFMAIAYFCFPLMTSLYQLYMVRALFAVGVAAASTVLIIYTGDYPQERSRAKWNGFMGLFQGVGVTLTAALLVKMPAILTARGFDPIEAGTYTVWVGTIICLIAAVVVFIFMKPGLKQQEQSKASFKELLTDGYRVAKKDSQIRLAYFASLAARGDIVVVGLFTFLWTSRFAIDNGMTIEQGYARGATIVPVIASTVLVTAPIFGFIMDRIDRVYGIMIAFFLSSLGYLAMGLVEDPMSFNVIPVAILLGMGEGACIISSTTLIGKTAPVAIRGTVFGAFAMCGAIGQMIAGGFGGFLFDYIYTGPYLLMSFLNFTVLLLAIYTWYTRRKQGADKNV